MRATVTLRAVSLTSEGFRLVAAHAAPMRASVRLAPPRTSSVVAHGGRLRVRANAAEDAQQKPSLGAMETGTAVVVIELPPFVKTSNNIPAMRDASKVISVGEPGRILDRKPKGVWVVRFKSGAYLIDEKYLELLEADESDD